VPILRLRSGQALKSRKMDARNGVTHQRLSQRWEQAVRPHALVGGMPQEANALGNARDMLTWGRHTRGHGCRKSLGLRQALKDLRTEDRTKVQL
jgi:hypothetical protein